MFNDAFYYEVNREERFFCFLLAHALLSSEQVKLDFIKLVKSKLDFELSAEPFEVYIEAAALRDYWHNLGDPTTYSAETHQKRRKILETILSECDLLSSILDQHDFFWTTEKREKLWSPSRWSEKVIKTLGLEKLLYVKWAFNAKPDIMIVSKSSVLLIEAKLESGEGQNESGYQQYEIQKLISRLSKLLIPQFSHSVFLNTVLELNSANGLSWKEIVTLLKHSQIDDFSKTCIFQLERFYT